jgi:AcrR family transcriptional regulator
MSSTEFTTRERILRAAWSLMAKRRGHGVRMEDIAEEAGVSRQAVYLHFTSRTELLIAAARFLDETLHLTERLQPVCAVQRCDQALDAYVEFWANYIPDIYALAKPLLAVRDTDEAAAAAWADRMVPLYEGCLTIIRRLAEEQQLAAEWSVEDAADFFWATISFQNWENLIVDRGWSKEQFIERTRLALRRALLKMG